MSCSTSRMPDAALVRRPRCRTAAELLGLVRVEPRRRLVEQQQVERARRGPGQLDQAALPGRQQPGLRRRRARPIPVSASASSVAASHLARSRRRAPTSWRQRVAPRPSTPRGRARRSRARSASRTAPCAGRCGRARAAAALRRAVAGDVARRAARTRPGVGPHQPAAGVERRRLAGAVRADQPGDPAHRRVEADARRRPRTPPKRTERSRTSSPARPMPAPLAAALRPPCRRGGSAARPRSPACGGRSRGRRAGRSKLPDAAAGIAPCRVPERDGRGADAEEQREARC